MPTFLEMRPPGDPDPDGGWEWGGGKAPMSDDVMDELFRCERYLGTFPRGMPVRACLRRQDERRDLLDEKGKACGKEAVYPFCAFDCELGQKNRARAGAAPAAPAERPEPRATPSARLWNGEAPDVPLGPPPATGARERAPSLYVLERTTDLVERPEPAHPAPEETEEGKVCTKCGKSLRPDNTKGVCGDRGACSRRAAEQGGAAPATATATERPARAARAARAARPAAKRRPLTHLVDLEQLEVRELVELRDSVQLELEARLDAAEEELVLLRAAARASVAGIAAQVALEEAEARAS